MVLNVFFVPAILTEIASQERTGLAAVETLLHAEHFGLRLVEVRLQNDHLFRHLVALLHVHFVHFFEELHFCL